MLKHRVIPVLLWKPPGLVKGVGFDSWRTVGAVMPAIKVFNLRDVDELILVDISATNEGRTPDFEELALLAAECFVPFTVGGGVNSVEVIRELGRHSRRRQRPPLSSRASSSWQRRRASSSSCSLASAWS